MVEVTLPETDLARVRRWVGEQNERIGEHIDEMRVEMDVDARAITILECRPPWREDFGPEWTRQEIARMRYTKSTGVWTLYWPDRSTVPPLRRSRSHADDRPAARRDRRRPHLHLLGLMDFNFRGEPPARSRAARGRLGRTAGSRAEWVSHDR